MKKRFFLSLFALSFIVMTVTVTSCDKDEWAKLNTNPNNILTPNASFMFTDLLLLNTNNAFGYDMWFRGYDPYTFVWSQFHVGTTNYSLTRRDENFVLQSGYSDNSRMGAFMLVQNKALRLRYVIDNELPDGDRDASQHIRAISYPLVIVEAMKVTDHYGSMIYSEAGLGHYTDPALLTPDFDTQAELFEIWDAELKAAFAVLTDEDLPQQTNLSVQDWVYQGNAERWAKYTNTVRLRLATRWLHQNPARAKAIVSEVYASGLWMDAVADDYIHFRGRTACRDQTTERYIGFPNEKFVNFLRDNRDPRLRWYFAKNRFSSSVIQLFIDQGVPLPDVVLSEIELDAAGNFAGWKPEFAGRGGATATVLATQPASRAAAQRGDLWARYHGAQIVFQDEAEEEVRNRYLMTAQWRTPVSGNNVFRPWSEWNTHFTQPKMTASGFRNYPDITYNAAGEVVTAANITTPGLNTIRYRGRLVTAAEANLILAEFAQLGAISADANALYRRGITLSIETHNATARDHNAEWYSVRGTDPYSTTTELRANEIADLLARPAYTLSSDPTKALEQIYLQLMIHHYQTPNEMYVTARRGGVPVIRDQVCELGLPTYTYFTPGQATGTFQVPRRFDLQAVSVADINGENKRKAAEAQGFDFPIPQDVIRLNSQRIWYDIPAPQWGAGPIIR